MLSESVSILNNKLMLVVLIGLLDLGIFIGDFYVYSTIGVFAAFFLSMVLFGDIVASVNKVETSSALEVIKKNIVNYIIVTIVLGLPVVLVGVVAQEESAAKELSKLIVGLLTIYVLPIVFMKHMGIPSIVVGVTYLFNVAKISVPIILTIIASCLVNYSIFAVWTPQSSPEQTVVGMLPYIICVSVISAYLSFLAFTMATKVLANNNETSEGKMA